MQVNGPEGLEISQEKIPGSKRSMYGYIYWPTPGCKGRTFKLSVSTDGTLISASAAPHCGVEKEEISQR